MLTTLKLGEPLELKEQPTSEHIKPELEQRFRPWVRRWRFTLAFTLASLKGHRILTGERTRIIEGRITWDLAKLNRKLGLAKQTLLLGMWHQDNKVLWQVRSSLFSNIIFEFLNYNFLCSIPYRRRQLNIIKISGPINYIILPLIKTCVFVN